jgi:small subunit ribosomal protein S3
MGHKVHPIGFRIGVIRDWEAKWYADRHYMEFLQEDLKLRKAVQSAYPEAGVSTVEIDRQANNVTLTIHTARPGILIGRGGQRVDELRANLEELTGKRIQLNIREVQQPELDAHLVAKSVAEQIERRVAYRRTLKQALLRTVQAGAKGMRISCAGRLDGAEIARRVTMHEGQVPLHTLRADIDYGFVEAHTIMGRVGVKVWIYKGDILPAAPEIEAEELPVEAIAETTVEAKPAEEVKEKPVTPVTARAVDAKVAPTLEPEVKEAEEAPVEVEAEAEVAAAAEEEKPAKRVVRRRPKAAVPEEEAEVKEAEEAPVEVAAEAEVAVAAEEEKPAKRVVKRRSKSAVPKEEAEVKEAEAAAVAEEGKPAKRVVKKRAKTAAPKERAEVKEAETAAVAEEGKPAKRVVKKRAKAATSAKSRGKKAEEINPETIADKSTEVELAENQGDKNVTT